jgi:ribose transport system permease protein
MKALVAQLMRDHGRTVAAGMVLLMLLLIFVTIHPRGPSPNTFLILSNQTAALALLAVGQTIIVFSRGIDLSIGPIMALTNCVASSLVNGSPLQCAIGVFVVILVGAVCGFLNGLVVSLGRMQPIIATLATGAVFSGVALIVRPIPGGEISTALSEFATGKVLSLVPMSFVLTLLLTGLVWGVVSRRPVGRAIVAIGSAEHASFMSGLPVERARIASYVLGGIFAAFAGLFFGFQTLSGDPSIGLSYTLNSIAAVVIGGTVLTGGTGSALGSIFGAAILRIVGSLMFFIGLSPLSQPLAEGMVLVVAVGLGATRILSIKNKLELFR